VWFWVGKIAVIYRAFLIKMQKANSLCSQMANGKWQMAKI
jgi:hypothetical protein